MTLEVVLGARVPSRDARQGGGNQIGGARVVGGEYHHVLVAHPGCNRGSRVVEIRDRVHQVAGEKQLPAALADEGPRWRCRR